MKSLKKVMSGIFLVAAMTAATAVPAAGAEQSYPERPVTLLLGFPPGGGADAVARLMAESLSKKLSQSFVVENKPGADSVIATSLLAKAKPDGYTVMLTMSPHVTNSLLHANLPYDILKDFSPVSMVASLPLVLVANPGFEPNNIQELIALAKTKPGQIYFGSPGPASTHFLAMELLKEQTGINLMHVPYKGGGPAMVDLLGGRIQLMFGSAVQTLPYLKDHRLKALGIALTTRDPLLPDVPTISESGAPGYKTDLWYGFIAPAGTPDAIVTKLNVAIKEILETSDIRKRLAEQGAMPVYSTPQEFDQKIRAEYVSWDSTIKTLGIKIN